MKKWLQFFSMPSICNSLCNLNWFLYQLYNQTLVIKTKNHFENIVTIRILISYPLQYWEQITRQVELGGKIGSLASWHLGIFASSGLGVSRPAAPAIQREDVPSSRAHDDQC